MSKNNTNETNDLYINWLEKSISEDHLKFYDYKVFKNKRTIGIGAFGKVVCANWKNSDTLFALKSFNAFGDNNVTLIKEVVNELKLQRKVDFHANIIRIYGITKEGTDIMDKYHLVLEYADSGTLNSYLDKHFDELKWNDKYQLALQLAGAVECIHEEDIIHRDLHADNILVHQKNIKLADFGLSRKIAEASNNASKVFGVIPYMDPKGFISYHNNGNNQIENYKLNKKSDVYSIGIIMWQISSGCRPFHVDGNKYDVSLALAIQGGKREEIVDGTPVRYSKLYKECWKYEPDERPDIQNVVLTLKSIISNNNKSRHLSIENNKENKSDSKPSHESIDINNGLTIDNISKIIKSENKSSFQQGSIETESNLSSISNPATNIFKSISNNFKRMIIDKLILYLIIKHNEGATFNQIKQFTNLQISQLNQSPNCISNWLIKNQVNPQYIHLLGFFYYHNIGISGNNNRKAFQLFSKAAENDYSIAQVYLAKCYNNGYGTKKNNTLAFELYQKSVDNGSIIGQFYLGYCYEFGIGVKKDEKKSVYWYQQAANNKNISAKIYLAECYKLGKGVEKNETKAFKCYKKLAEREIDDAQYQLGNCFYFGIGTKKDEELALCWYKKATINGNIIAKYILEQNFKKINFKIKHIAEIKFYKILYLKGLCQLGLNNYYGIGTKRNIEKAFYYFQKAAEDGYKVAQFNLGNCYVTGDGVKKDERKAFELYKKSAEQGYLEAQNTLGNCYKEGIGTEVNKAKAFELYKIATREGNVDSLLNLGMCYILGEGVNKDEKKAFELYKKAAERGNKIAQNNLGVLYSQGKVIKKNFKKAIYWFQKAAKNGFGVACYNLGECYELGNGVDKDERKAFEYYKKSAEYGDKYVKFQLGYCYINGIGTVINREKGFMLYDEAVSDRRNSLENISKEKGKKKVQETGDIEEDVQEETECDDDDEMLNNLDTLRYWYRQVSESDNKEALYKLGEIYELGKGVYADEFRAFSFYKQAAEKGCANGKYKLGYCYFHGFGIGIDKEKAYELYKIAADEGNSDAQNVLQLFYIKNIDSSVY